VDFNVTDQLPIRFSAFVRYWKKVGVHFKKAYDSVRKEVLYNILIVWNPHEISQAH
jgi:hypothetical protein